MEWGAFYIRGKRTYIDTFLPVKLGSKTSPEIPTQNYPHEQSMELSTQFPMVSSTLNSQPCALLLGHVIYPLLRFKRITSGIFFRGFLSAINPKPYTLHPKP